MFVCSVMLCFVCHVSNLLLPTSQRAMCEARVNYLARSTLTYKNQEVSHMIDRTEQNRAKQTQLNLIPSCNVDHKEKGWLTCALHVTR